MRTTIDIPDALYRQMKATSALRGLKLKEFVTAAIERLLAEETSSRTYEVELPLIRTGEPDSLKLTNAEIENLLT